MARPQRSTRDTFLDQFSDFPTDIQEGLIDTCQLLHRQAKRREKQQPERPGIQFATLEIAGENLQDALARARENLTAQGRIPAITPEETHAV